MAYPTPDMFCRSQFLDAPQQLTMTASSVKSTLLAPGMYLLYSTATIAWLQGPTGVTATSASIPLPASTFFGPIFVTDATDGYIAAIAASGTVSIIKVS